MTQGLSNLQAKIRVPTPSVAPALRKWWKCGL
jgi:hypothetical protein